MSKRVICKSCGYKGRPKRKKRGSLLISNVLWFFVVPGFLYSIWRMTSQYDVCPKCGSDELEREGDELIQGFLEKHEKPEVAMKRSPPLAKPIQALPPIAESPKADAKPVEVSQPLKPRQSLTDF